MFLVLAFVRVGTFGRYICQPNIDKVSLDRFQTKWNDPEIPVQPQERLADFSKCWEKVLQCSLN